MDCLFVCQIGQLRSWLVSVIKRFASNCDWPMDGGAFITLPQVYSEHPDHLGSPLRSNLGMYRVQLSGNAYVPDEEIGLHYQIHRGIGCIKKPSRSRKTFSGGYFCWGSTLNGFSAVMPYLRITRSRVFGLMAGRNFRYTLPRLDGSCRCRFCHHWYRATQAEAGRTFWRPSGLLQSHT